MTSTWLRAPGVRVGWLALLVALAVAARLPFLARPPTPDEGGFLVVASQWSPGRSLYGDYWVDRPPLLIGFFELGHRLGGVIGLHVLGLVLVAVSILLAAAIGRCAHDLDPSAGLRTATTGLAAALAATILLVSPVSGAVDVNGELVAVPVVLLGTLLVLLAAREDRGPRRHLLLLGAGASAAAAALVKQNVVDVVVLLVVAAVTLLPRDRVRTVLTHLTVAAAGALTLLLVVLAWAALRGTGPVSLWEAIITFRVQAGETIRHSASAATRMRLLRDLGALALSGAPLVVLGLLALAPRRGSRPGAPLRWAAAALLAWEGLAALAGGSYWLHYLVGLVPGLVLCVAVVAPRASAARRRWLRAGLVYAAVVASVGVVWTTLVPTTDPALALTGWLDAHRRPGDTLTVAFGHADLLQATGMRSPYSELWSLPVRVRDPRLTRLAGVLSDPSRPTWVVTDRTLDTWGIDPAAGQRALAEHYRQVASIDGYRVYRAEP